MDEQELQKPTEVSNIRGDRGQKSVLVSRRSISRSSFKFGSSQPFNLEVVVQSGSCRSI